jgi:hypothetical protein
LEAEQRELDERQRRMDEIQKRIEEEEMRKLLERKAALEAENKRKLEFIQQRAALTMPSSTSNMSSGEVQAKPKPISYEEILLQVDKLSTVDRILSYLKNAQPPRITTEMPTNFKMAALAYHPDKQGHLNDIEWTNFCHKLMQILIKVNRWDQAEKK